MSLTVKNLVKTFNLGFGTLCQISEYAERGII